MKTLPPALLNALKSREYIQTLLLGMDIAGDIFRLTMWNTSVYYNSEIYSPRGMRFADISYSSSQIVDNLRITLDDVDRSLYATFGDYGSGKYPVVLTLAILDSLGKVTTSFIPFRGFVDKWDYSPGRLNLVASSIFVRWARPTTSQFSGSCRWKVFKGIECGYSGSSATCDRTYNQCEGYGNEANFGGYRWLPSMVNKKVTV